MTNTTTTPKTKTSTERVKVLRERNKQAGLTAVQGIWAKPEHHKKIKDFAKTLK